MKFVFIIIRFSSLKIKRVFSFSDFPCSRDCRPKKTLIREALIRAYLEEPYVPHPIMEPLDANPPQGVILVNEKK